MDKIDFKKLYKELFQAPVGRFKQIEVPTLRFLKVDGHGDPNTAEAFKNAVEWLYSVSYGMKFAAKTAQSLDYVVPPLEGLWWADDPASFVARRKAEWHWTLMIMAPDFIGLDLFEAAIRKTSGRLGEPPDSLRLEPYVEGRCLQALHVGSYDDEGPLLAKLYNETMPAQGFVRNGHHHEIYLSDARKTAPSKLRTILRQPVKPA
ncbi:GyrI-like domain-containing protein [Microvirga splendida]|uniref:GyrI-like domain-containing protein n=1 Tax=Microvirga splendida TaxID=2795727 RepID=A0ABS0Y0C9_9HYPH|nr:GyrI-like domain-containing protein [Microvirga splendida]MBJ6125460.1 GyrI-like domain-containing protein [Microvirga splendida]